ncbi:MAG: hypothetical protein ACP5G1_00590 [Nanopusillaceae archaeon]
MATTSKLKEELVNKFKNGVPKEKLDQVVQEIANKLGKKPSVVKALVTRYMNKGYIKESGGKLVWAGQ